MTTTNYKPTGWQIDAKSLDSEKIQLWLNGIMIAVISRKEAAEMVTNSQAFVISGQAIGALDAKGNSAA